jgi:hypothetical protein
LSLRRTTTETRKNADFVPMTTATMDDLETLETDEAEALSPEEIRILSWRHDQMLSLGLTEAEASLLAEGGADLGLLRRLVSAGCAPSLAFRIAF